MYHKSNIQTRWDLRIEQLERKAYQNDDSLPSKEWRELYQIRDLKNAYLSGYRYGKKIK